MEDLSPTAESTTPERARRRLTAQETRDRRRRILTWALSLTLGALLVNALVGENGYLATMRAARDIAVLQGQVARIRVENQRLQQESRRLQDDPTAVEEAARRTLGMVRPGETMVVLRDAQPLVPSQPSK
jgi:cell division protein FtsB